MLDFLTDGISLELKKKLTKSLGSIVTQGSPIASDVTVRLCVRKAKQQPRKSERRKSVKMIAVCRWSGPNDCPRDPRLSCVRPGRQALDEATELGPFGPLRHCPCTAPFPSAIALLGWELSSWLLKRLQNRASSTTFQGPSTSNQAKLS